MILYLFIQANLTSDTTFMNKPIMDSNDDGLVTVILSCTEKSRSKVAT
jgi:hypothetical protein